MHKGKCHLHDLWSGAWKEGDGCKVLRFLVCLKQRLLCDDKVCFSKIQIYISTCKRLLLFSLLLYEFQRVRMLLLFALLLYKRHYVWSSNMKIWMTCWSDRPLLSLQSVHVNMTLMLLFCSLQMTKMKTQIWLCLLVWMAPVVRKCNFYYKVSSYINSVCEYNPLFAVGT